MVVSIDEIRGLPWQEDHGAARARDQDLGGAGERHRHVGHGLASEGLDGFDAPDRHHRAEVLFQPAAFQLVTLVDQHPKRFAGVVDRDRHGCDAPQDKGLKELEGHDGLGIGPRAVGLGIGGGMTLSLAMPTRARDALPSRGRAVPRGPP